MNTESKEMKTVENQKSEHAKVPLTVSPETYALIMCLDSLSKHWRQVEAALQKAYHKETVYKMMEKDYECPFFELEDRLQRFIVESIERNMEQVDFKQI